MDAMGCRRNSRSGNYQPRTTCVQVIFPIGNFGEGDCFLRGVVLYAEREVVPFGDKLWVVPLGVWRG
jgi:hypothetical protein